MAVPGEAFGAAEAGASPSKTGQPPAVESAVSKALRGAGFPDVESKVVPSAAVNKITSGIQKRMIKMDELLNKLGDAPKTSLGDKILWLPFFENQKSFNFSMLRNSLSNSTRIYHDVLPLYPDLLSSAFSLVGLFSHSRMVQKLQDIKTSIEKRLDKLTSMYGDGLVDGFSQQFLAILDGTFLRVSCIKFTSCNSRWVGGRVLLTVTCHTRQNPEGIKYEVHKCLNSQPNGLTSNSTS